MLIDTDTIIQLLVLYLKVQSKKNFAFMLGTHHKTYVYFKKIKFLYSAKISITIPKHHSDIHQSYGRTCTLKTEMLNSQVASNLKMYYKC